VPGILMGCTLGLLYLELLLQGMGASIYRVGGQSYLVIGAAAMLAGYTRLTYSLAVIMMETTQAVNLFLPILVGIIVANAVARIFNRSIYEYGIRSK
jgi:chloride channel 7